MHLNENDPRLQDYLDDRLSPAETREVEDHLNACSECQALVSQAQQVDADLTRHFATVSLSPDFTARLLQRANRSGAPAPVTESQKRQLENELRSTWNTESRNFFRSQLPLALDWLGYSTAAAVGFYLLSHLALATLKSQLKPAFVIPASSTLTVAAAAAALFMLAGWAVASRRKLARWLGDFA
jgi:anti-sigma factor RsiW